MSLGIDFQSNDKPLLTVVPTALGKSRRTQVANLQEGTFGAGPRRKTGVCSCVVIRKITNNAAGGVLSRALIEGTL